MRVWKDKAVKEIDKRAEIYLTDEEIDAMYELKLTGDNEVVRDIFLIGNQRTVNNDATSTLGIYKRQKKYTK